MGFRTFDNLLTSSLQLNSAVAGVHVEQTGYMEFRTFDNLLTSSLQLNCLSWSAWRTGRQVTGGSEQCSTTHSKEMEVTPYSTLHKLHWLPVKFCCKYKMGTFASCHFNSTLQPYLSALLCSYQTPSTPQSSSKKLSKIQKQNSKPYGECSYSLTFRKYGIYCLPAWRIPPSPLYLSSKPSSRIVLFRQACP